MFRESCRLLIFAIVFAVMTSFCFYKLFFVMSELLDIIVISSLNFIVLNFNFYPKMVF